MSDERRISTRSVTGSLPSVTLPSAMRSSNNGIHPLPRRSPRVAASENSAGSGTATSAPPTGSPDQPTSTEHLIQSPEENGGLEEARAQMVGSLEAEEGNRDDSGLSRGAIAPTVSFAVDETQRDKVHSGEPQISIAEQPTAIGAEDASQTRLDLPLGNLPSPEQDGADIQAQQEEVWTIELPISKAESGRDHGYRAFTTLLGQMYQGKREGRSIPVKVEIGWKENDGNRVMEWVQEQPAASALQPEAENISTQLQQITMQAINFPAVQEAAPLVVPQAPTSTPAPVISVPELQSLPIYTTGGILTVVQQDLDRNGGEEMVQISIMQSMDLYKQAGFFFNRRMIGIIDSLGVRFGLAPGQRTVSIVYHDRWSLNTTDMMEWANRHGYRIGAKAISNQRTLWGRAAKGMRVLSRRREEVAAAAQLLIDGWEKTQKMLELGDMDRNLELLKVLVDGTDIDADGVLQHVTAADIWVMKQREWSELIEPWCPVQRRRPRNENAA